MAAGVVTSTLQIGAGIAVAAIGSIFFGVLNTTAAAYGEAFPNALAVAVGLTLSAVLNRSPLLVIPVLLYRWLRNDRVFPL